MIEKYKTLILNCRGMDYIIDEHTKEKLLIQIGGPLRL